MPLTSYQAELAKLLSTNRTPESHLAGGAALHFKPNSLRYSQDLDYFHDSIERVAEAFAKDEKSLKDFGCDLTIEMKQPGYIRAQVLKNQDSTKIEWSHDTAWRFMPPELHPDFGYMLHPVDLAINKVLALVGRDEPRDFIDVIDIHQNILSIGALVWAAAGKDPGFTPLSLLELLKRRGKYHKEDFEKLRLNVTIDLTKQKQTWISMLTEAERFISERPPEEMGCLYFSRGTKTFFAPTLSDTKKTYTTHYGQPGGVIPKVFEL